MRTPLDFSGKAALVTGTAPGMGLGTAKAFEKAGATVDLAGLKDETVKPPAQKLVDSWRKALTVRCDVSDDAQAALMIDPTVTELGQLDVVFNSAWIIAPIAPLVESSREDWDSVIAINLRSGWSCMKHELPQATRQAGGAVVNDASVGALTGNTGIDSYIASNHGAVGQTLSATLEYVTRGIRVTTVNPSLIETQPAPETVKGDERAYAEIAARTSMELTGRREETAPAMLWLCGPAASYVIGHALTVDDRMTV